MIRYIAAPYGADTPEGIRWNIARAELLGKVTLAYGHAPIVPHTLGSALLGTDETPESRERALRYGLDLVAGVAAAGGELLVLTRDDGSISDGCLAEIRHFRLSHSRDYPEVWARSWQEVRTDCERYGFAAEWERLAVRPTA